MVAVGGTTLNLDLFNTFQSETAWSGSGGGTSTVEPEPAYQYQYQGTGQRTIPDVSFDADPNTGVPVYDSYNNGSGSPWGEVGGTSLACPCWAGLIADANSRRASKNLPTLNTGDPTQTLEALYSLPPGDFRDITSGSNGDYSAGVGYDEVTGRGSPYANLVIPALGSYQSLPAVAAGTASPVSATGAVVSASVNTQGSNDRVYFQYSTDPSFPPTVATSLGSGFQMRCTTAVDALGDVFVADFYNNAVKEILPDGTIKTIGSGFSARRRWRWTRTATCSSPTPATTPSRKCCPTAPSRPLPPG